MSKRPIVDINIGGQDRPLRFGHVALANFCDQRDIALADLTTDLGTQAKLGDIIALLHAGLQDGARKRAENGQQPPQPPESWEVVADWMDEASDEEIATAIQHFEEAMADKEDEEETVGKGQETEEG